MESPRESEHRVRDRSRRIARRQLTMLVAAVAAWALPVTLRIRVPGRDRMLNSTMGGTAWSVALAQLTDIHAPASSVRLQLTTGSPAAFWSETGG